jgi:hypothetical protein
MLVHISPLSLALKMRKNRWRHTVGIDTGSSWLTGYRVSVPGPHDSSAGSLMNEYIKLPFYADVVMGI